MQLPIWMKQLERLTVDNSPAILTAIGVTGTVTTAVLAGKASYKAALVIDEMERQEGTPLDNKERLVKNTQVVWPFYIPAVGMGATTIVCIVGASRIGMRRAAAMAAAYSISERAFEEYRDKVVEKMGENKEQAVRDEVAQDHISRSPVSSHQVIVTNGGNVLCYDMYTGRYFNSDMETIKKAQNDLNYVLLRESYASLNDFYDKVGLDWVSSGDELGWTVGDPLELRFSATISEDQRPCIAIDFSVTPVRNYYKGY